jgi:hypothetical protein
MSARAAGEIVATVMIVARREVRSSLALASLNENK